MNRYCESDYDLWTESMMRDSVWEEHCKEKGQEVLEKLKIGLSDERFLKLLANHLTEAYFSDWSDVRDIAEKIGLDQGNFLCYEGGEVNFIKYWESLNDL